MSMRFIITVASEGVNATTVDERNKITQILKAKDWQVWHWLESVWLVLADTAPASEVTAATALRDEIKAITNTHAILVTSIPGKISYAGVLPTDSHAWLSERWQGTAKVKRELP